MSCARSILVVAGTSVQVSQAGGRGIAVEAGPADAPAAPAIEYRRRMWTRDEGLPNNAVDCLLQTRDGWL
jgi:hypothetical protein